MYAAWKFFLLPIVVAFILLTTFNTGALTEEQQRGNRRLQQNQQLVRDQRAQQRSLPNDGSGNSTTNKCIIEVPTIALRDYPHAKVIRMGSSMHLSIIETCCPGYHVQKLRSVAGGIICIPICKACFNGLCVRPNDCACFEGFVKNDNGDCVFTCPISCLNGQCYLDGTCKCHYGYKLDETRKFCRPICSEGCNGWMQNCTAPETCGCSNGYRLKEDGCRPICELDCGIGGHCIEPNVCDCQVDYTLKDGVCQSDCYQKCENGICLSKNRCICYPGFKYHEKTMTCIPV